MKKAIFLALLLMVSAGAYCAVYKSWTASTSTVTYYSVATNINQATAKGGYFVNEGLTIDATVSFECNNTYGDPVIVRAGEKICFDNFPQYSSIEVCPTTTGTIYYRLTAGYDKVGVE